MNLSYSGFMPWALLAVALAVWAGVGFFAWQISAAGAARAAIVSDAADASSRQAAALREKVLIRDTKDARAELEALAQSDVPAILDAIDAVGTSAGVKMQIGQALSAPAAKDALIHNADFIIETEGSFAEVMRAAHLLAALPIPSFTEELQFERMPASSGAAGHVASPWQFTARIRFLTTANISS